ncbi:MAG: peptidyl-prolyl cis-trans isomerase [Lentisphaeria bacterium]|nr:peptidyl-prolyl cis-trans isomerase [Lentisphaeria bacterium]
MNVLMKTSMGDIELELFEKEAPETVANFIGYVRDGFYKNTIFHRIIDNFMVQGGGFTEDFVQKETKAPIKNEADNQISNKKGTIAMARTSNPHSATCQFFINSKDNDFLDFKAPTPMHYGYCVFGKVVNGIEVIEKMSKVETGNRGFHQDVPVENVVITDIEILN